jgi:hypothetical protein
MLGNTPADKRNSFAGSKIKLEINPARRWFLDNEHLTGRLGRNTEVRNDAVIVAVPFKEPQWPMPQDYLRLESELES